MRIEPFEMERWQSVWENRVRYNLSESGVHPMTVIELCEMADLEAAEVLLPQRLVYNQSNGTPELRETIAGMYPGATEANILVTNGGSEANFVTALSLLEAGDRAVLMVPNYMQLWGLGRAFAGDLQTFPLVEERRWAPDLDALRRATDERTRCIIVTNPNNPTGAILEEREMDEIVAIAGRAGAWLIADEIYAGSELSGPRTPSFWGRYDRLLITNGLSKAYGLPGLRIGWIAGPADEIERIWSYKDYTTIAPSTLSDLCARIALRPEMRDRIRRRTQKILNMNFPVLRGWIEEQGDLFQYVPPRAGAICYLRHTLAVPSSVLAERLKDEEDVLVVPGVHFGMERGERGERYLRIGYGVPKEELQHALRRVRRTLDALR
ncbi:MAG: aminotransferase class I/II-fold pyridoxal phosphate-dependent enzyme, partial [Gemmatimonadetes bacterium]|nr:aminotransferase class I/II-fold pyridoxal phosphate-dependent enzyme [Gemmatimonadota bacterium]